MSFAEDIRKLRLEKGLTQQEVGNALGIAGSRVSAYETGLKLPTARMLKLYCDFYDLDYEEALEKYEVSKKHNPHLRKSTEKRTDFAKMLSEARIAKGLLLKDVSERVGAGIASINQWETSYALPNEKYLERIAEAYEIDLGELISEWEKERGVKNTEYKELGRKIRNARLKASLSQKEASELIGVGVNDMTPYETGLRKTPDNMLAVMADVYNDESLRPKSCIHDFYGSTDFDRIRKEVFEHYPMNLLRLIVTEENVFTVNWDNFREILNSLTEREQAVLLKRYKYFKTLQEVGKELNLTRERVRQIEAKALQKLRMNTEYILSIGTDITELRLENAKLRKTIKRLEGEKSNVSGKITELASLIATREI